jgi:cell wall-associated NlpC family hydrolase
MVTPITLRYGAVSRPNRQSDLSLPGTVFTMMKRALLAPLALITAATAPVWLAAQRPIATLSAASLPGTMVVRARIEGPDVVRTAEEYLGVRYRLGGTTPRAFDCSGFVRYVFAQHGINLPRTAHEQAAVGNAPFPGDLQPGDLLFFYGGHGAQHIAIYVGGDSIIHASSSAGRVKLDRLSGKGAERTWFDERLIAVRRLLPQEGVFYLPASPTSTAAAGGTR